nr:caspase family protein [Smithellaceae bacterium]
MKKLLAAVIIILIGLLAGCVGPLITAAGKGDDREVKALLDGGADINAKGGAATPLTLAIFYRHSSTAKLLIERGADVHQPAAIIHGFDTPLMIAAARGNSEIVNLLINKGADLEHALSMCQQKSGVILVGHHYQNCQATLRSVKIKQEAAKAQDLSKNDHAKKDAKPFSVKSDISTPSFVSSENIFSSNDLAVIIGIETYQNLPQSDYSVNDAKMVKDYVKALGFRERNIEFLTNERATHSGIVKVIDAWLRNNARPGGRIFVYYSGHGAPDPATGEAYIVPYDGDPNYLPETSYPLKKLYEKMGSLPATEIMVVLDACFSGAGGRSVLAKGARPL